VKPPADLPLELVLLAEAFARRLDVPVADFWAIVYRKKEPPPGWAARWAEAFSPLTSSDESANVRYEMQPLPTIDRLRKVGRPIEGGHPFTAWLASVNVTVTEWAAAHKDPDTGRPYTMERVKSWYRKRAPREIPRYAADLIASESTDEKTGRVAVPATRRTWKNGIREA
jgi:hypothetical protein